MVLTGFLPALGISWADVPGAMPQTTPHGVSVEYSIAYGLGHDLIGNDVGDLEVADLSTTATNIDGNLSDALRSLLFGSDGRPGPGPRRTSHLARP